MNQFKPASFCPGCGYPVILNFLHKVLREKNLNKKAVMGLDIGCALLAWDFLPINTFQTHHGRVVATMVGFKQAKSDSLVLAVAGDGGAYAIGMQSLFWAALRNDPITVLVVNNSVYGMTGGQVAPTSLQGQRTDTTPAGSDQPTILGPELIRNLNPKAYIARTAVNMPQDLQVYLNKAIEAQQAGNFSLIEILSYCPTNWKTKGVETNQFLEEKMKPIFKVGEL